MRDGGERGNKVGITIIISDDILRKETIDTHKSTYKVLEVIR